MAKREYKKVADRPRNFVHSQGHSAHRPKRIGTKYIVIDGKRYKVKVFEPGFAFGAVSWGFNNTNPARKEFKRLTLSKLDGERD